jgi:hypothetical protein
MKNRVSIGETILRRSATMLSYIRQSLTDVVTYSVTNGLTSKNGSETPKLDAVDATKRRGKGLTIGAGWSGGGLE